MKEWIAYGIIIAVMAPFVVLILSGMIEAIWNLIKALPWILLGIGGIAVFLVVIGGLSWLFADQPPYMVPLLVIIILLSSIAAQLTRKP